MNSMYDLTLALIREKQRTLQDEARESRLVRGHRWSRGHAHDDRATRARRR